MTAAEITILLFAGMAALAAWCVPWGALADLLERVASRRAVNRRNRQIAADTWARHEAEEREAEMWRRVQQGVVERLNVEALRDGEAS